jgi:hypothetical protein
MTSAEEYFYLAEKWYELATYWASEPQSDFARQSFLKCKIEAFLYLNKAKECIHGNSR